MASIVVAGDTSGSITLAAPAVAGSNTLTLPAVTDTLVGLAATQTLTNKSIAATQLTGTIAAARLPAGSVLQVVSTTKTDSFSGNTQTTWTDITGMSVSITPTSSSNKVLVQVAMTGGSYSGVGIVGWRLMRDSTAIDIGDAAGSRPRATGYPAGPSQFWPGFSGTIFLDSPATTSSVTYKLQYWAEGSAVFYVNRSASDRDTSNYDPRTTSTIMVMEVAA